MTTASAYLAHEALHNYLILQNIQLDSYFIQMNGIKSKIVKRKGERIDGYINIHIEEAREKSSKSNFGL